MNRKKKSRGNLLGWVAIVISVGALCVASLRSKPIALEWAGVLVATLAALVTALITWQIYTLVDIRKIRNEVVRGRDEVNYEAARSMALTNNAISEYFYSTLAGQEQPFNQRLFQYVRYKVLSLKNASAIGDYAACAAVVQMLKETVHPERISFNSAQKKVLFDLLANVKNAPLIDGFSDVLVLLSRIDEQETNPKNSKDR